MEKLIPGSPAQHANACGDFGISQVPREPQCAFALLSDPGRVPARGLFRARMLFPHPVRRKPSTTNIDFGAPSHGFCTGCLRFVPWSPTTTQDSLPAGGQPLLGGIGYPRNSNERFLTSLCLSSSFPELTLARTGLNTFTCVMADHPPSLWPHVIRYLLTCKVPFWPGG